MFKSVVRKFSTLHTNTKLINLTYANYEPLTENTDKKMVFLHGLFGSKMNWRSIALNDAIRQRREPILIDMRNHGESDHHESMTYKEMAEDVIRLMDKLLIKKFTLLGHSMGGKTAISLASLFPDRLDGLIVVDTAPNDNNTNPVLHQSTMNVIEKAYKYDITDKTRAQAQNDLINLTDKNIGNLLNTNLTYTGKDLDKVKWRINISSIFHNAKNIFGYDKVGEYKKDLAILVGEKSYQFDLDVFRRVFPEIQQNDLKIIKNAGICNIKSAGHWLHFDQPNETIKEICSFLDFIDKK